MKFSNIARPCTVCRALVGAHLDADYLATHSFPESRVRGFSRRSPDSINADPVHQLVERKAERGGQSDRLGR